ncbi:MAG: antibiotic biosynthesis monooxygenase [Dehalococcoidia bacterium]|nr:antibiotic biosynthesis monooxygenase [Dehalococcoidia bacterium]
MGRLALVQTVHLLPGKADEAIQWFREGEVVRKLWGMSDQIIMRKSYDPSVYLVVQIWESMDAYTRWKNSKERGRSLEEGRKFRVREPSVVYEVV